MHPIIFLWAHPRSMSTAVERVMRERGDLHCLHEPFLHYYYLERSTKPLAYFEADENHPVSYAQTRDSILALARETPVFAKDMSYYVMPELLRDVRFCRRVTHCFLVRNPYKSMLSYYRLDPDFSQQEVGIESSWALYSGLESIGIKPAAVLDAEALQTNPQAVMKKFCRLLGLKYMNSALQWQQSSTPLDWHYVQGWHKQVSSSSGIKAGSPEHDAASKAEFDRLLLEKPVFRQYLDIHNPAYLKLKSLCISA